MRRSRPDAKLLRFYEVNLRVLDRRRANNSMRERTAHRALRDVSGDGSIKVTNRFFGEGVVEPLPGVLVSRDGNAGLCEHDVLIEHNLDVYLNGVLTMRIVCTPDDLAELVVGRLFSEGYILSADEVTDIYICEFGTRAQVSLSGAAPDFSRTRIDTVPSCCTGNKTYNDYFLHSADIAPVHPIDWEIDWIFKAADKFSEDSPIHKTTGGTHSCYLLIDGVVSACCEDIGRHNAFDKILGAALLGGIDLRRALIFSSGRLPADMVMKAIRAGVPILASKAVPTNETIELARRYDLTLVCSAHRDSAIIYHDPSEASALQAAINPSI